MSTITFLCILGMVAIIISCFRRDADLFSPFRIFGFMWFFAIGLTDLKFSRLQNEWSFLSWVILLLGVGSFILGNFFVYVITLAKPKYSVLEMRDIVRNSHIKDNKLFAVIVIHFLLYSASLTIEAIIAGGLPISSSHPDKARMEFGIFGIHLIVSSMPVLLVLILEYFMLIRGEKYKKILLAAFFVAVVGSYTTLLVRLNYIVFLIIIATVAYYSSRFFRARYVIGALAMIFAVFALVVQVREVRYAENFVYVISDMKFSRTYAAFAGPYMYIVMNLENFARLVNQLDYFTFGYYSFDFLFALTGLKHSLAEYFGLVERLYQIATFNTFPFLLPYYRDFGLLGIAIFPMMLGFAIGNIYYWMISTGRLVAIATYAFCVFVMVISFFTNPLTMLSYIIVLVLLVIVHLYITDDRRLPRGAN